MNSVEGSKQELKINQLGGNNSPIKVPDGRDGSFEKAENFANRQNPVAQGGFDNSEDSEFFDQEE